MSANLCAGLVMLAALGACAGNGPLTHATGETASAAPRSAAETPVVTKAVAQRPEQTRAEGPMQIHAPRDGHGDAQITNAALEPDGDRMAFVGWFGAAAEPARAPSPVVELRKARAVTAKQKRPSTKDGERRMFSEDENGRLLPSTMALPEPDGVKPAASRTRNAAPVTPVNHTAPAETEKPRLTTGSLRPPAEKPDKAKGKQDAVVRHLREMEKKLTAVRNGTDTPATVIASASAAGPTRQSPLRIHMVRGRSEFNAREREALQSLAGHQRDSGRKLHILGVARGRAGGTRESRERVRRLHGHADRAAVYLARQGVPRSRIDVATSEQRMTGIDFGPSGGEDMDRLEFYLD
ncbi:MAG: hypothetical protein ACR2PM_14735 [Hyphomicrobiales bacterium]